jgi:hypothetical protein
VLTTNPQDSAKTDISVKNLETGGQEFFITLLDVRAGHSHPCEYRNGHLYVIKRIGYDVESGEEWTDELWKYDADGKGTKLFSAQGFDFRVAPAEKHIAIRKENLLLLDFLGSPLQEFTVEQLSGREEAQHAAPSVHVALLKWSDDNEEFWGALHSGPSPGIIFKVSVPSWELCAYNVSELHIPWEYDLDANMRRLVYSDYPQIYDTISLEEFKKSQQVVTLFVHDLSTRDTQAIATLAAKEFNPIWLDDEIIEYDSPDGEGRVIYTTDQGHQR